MSRKSRVSQPDTNADIELRECLQSIPPVSFVMKAGAGSGKTTSLIKALDTILQEKKHTLIAHRKKVACITYTEVAAEQIWADVLNNPLVHVSTIHSFLWSFIQPFQTDIKAWVIQRIAERIEALQVEARDFGSRVQQRTRLKNANEIRRYTELQSQISEVDTFRYGTGSDYINGILGHDDMIKMVPRLILEQPLLSILLAQLHPYMFVDESQDTMPEVVQALVTVSQQNPNSFCLGFFGDPMQKIYLTGQGDIPLPANWRAIDKPENFRCPKTVLDVANAIRIPGDGLEQTRGRMASKQGELVSVQGTARIFVLPADDRRDANVTRVRQWIADRNNDPAWRLPAPGQSDFVKILVIVHRMAATRLGFGNLYSAMNDRAPEKFKAGFLDGTAWPLRPFLNFVLPLATAMQEGREFDAIKILREHSPLLDKKNLSGVNVAERLAMLRETSQRLASLFATGSNATNLDVLRCLSNTRIYDIDPRFNVYLQAQQAALGDQNAPENEERASEYASVETFLACHATEFKGYQEYIDDRSPFSTQQGIKGAEFDRVLVILDDEEGRYSLFSYEKLLQIKPLSETDQENIRQGLDNSIDRTRRLFYVCCTRAMQDLAVILFTADPNIAVACIRDLAIFPDNSILSLEDLQN